MIHVESILLFFSTVSCMGFTIASILLSRVSELLDFYRDSNILGDNVCLCMWYNR